MEKSYKFMAKRKIDKKAQKINKTADALNESSPKNTVQNVGRLGNAALRPGFGIMPSVFGKLGGQLLENIVRPGKQGGFLSDQSCAVSRYQTCAVLRG